ncbi:MAG TPA: hypothetical protein DIC60_05635 [Lachnospiraceae bacterium]|nr:hypothetical protein [Lachnospiraceae bacterium]
MEIENQFIQRVNKVNLKKQKRLKVKNPRMRRFCNALRNHPRKEYLMGFLNKYAIETTPYQLLEMAFEMLTDDYDDMLKSRFIHSRDEELLLCPWKDQREFWHCVLMRKVFLNTSFQKRYSTLPLQEIQLWQNFYIEQNIQDENGGKSDRAIQYNMATLFSNNVFEGIFYLGKTNNKDKYITTFYPKLTMLLISNLKRTPFTKFENLSLSHDLNTVFYKNLIPKYLIPNDKISSAREESHFLKSEALNFMEGVCNACTKLNFFHMAYEKKLYYVKLKKGEPAKFIQETMNTILREYSYLGQKKLFEWYLENILNEDNTKEDVEEFHYFFNNQFLLLGSRLYERFLSNYSKLLNNYYPIIQNRIDQNLFHALEKSFEIIDKQWPSEFESLNKISISPNIFKNYKKIKSTTPEKTFHIPKRLRWRTERLKLRSNSFKFQNMKVKKGTNPKSTNY